MSRLRLYQNPLLILVSEALERVPKAVKVIVLILFELFLVYQVFTFVDTQYFSSPQQREEHLKKGEYEIDRLPLKYRRWFYHQKE
jgi:hypothetical protein